MINSEKLSLFRTGEDDSTGLTDVKFSPDPIMLISKLSLNKQTISNLQGDIAMEAGNFTTWKSGWRHHCPRPVRQERKSRMLRNAWDDIKDFFGGDPVYRVCV